MTRPYVDVTVVDFAAHTAFLDPVTGIGYLVLPPAGSDIEALSDFTMRRLLRVAGVRDVTSSIVLETVKRSPVIPLEELAPE